mmetsp:Transcript_13353/g.25443  ORF Transcript_13353/g.25443 Transcript_13353/m.25443 type:complete len:80 (+) Transcript_13353:199-438(+)
MEEGEKVVDECGLLEASSLWNPPLPAGDVDRDDGDDVDKEDAEDHDEGETLGTDAAGLLVACILDRSKQSSFWDEYLKR